MKIQNQVRGSHFWRLELGLKGLVTHCIGGISHPSWSVVQVALLKKGSWQSVARGMVLISLPPTVVLRVSHSSSEGQQLSPGKHLQVDWYASRQLTNKGKMAQRPRKISEVLMITVDEWMSGALAKIREAQGVSVCSTCSLVRYLESMNKKTK